MPHLQGRLGVLGLAPQIRGQETVGLGQGIEGSLDEVAQGLAATAGRGVAVLNTGHLQDLLGHAGGHNTSTTGSGDQTNADRATLAGDLGGHGVHLADLVTPVATANGDTRHLGQDDGTADGGGNLKNTE